MSAPCRSFNANRRYYSKRTAQSEQSESVLGRGRPRTTPAHIAKDPLLFAQHIAKIHEIKTLEDWYSISARKIVTKGNTTNLRQIYGNSIYNLVVKAYPEHNWQLWKFASRPPRWWRVPGVLKQYFDHAGAKLGITTSNLEKWYKVKDSVFKSKNPEAVKLIADCGKHLGLALQKAYPDHNWELWMFVTPPPLSWWKQPLNRRAYLDWLASKLQLSSMEDWYKVDRTVVANNKGSSLLRLPNFSTSRCIMEAYPEHDWKPWFFTMVDRGYWKDNNNVKRYLEWLAPIIGVKEMEDWYNVTHHAFRYNRGSTLLRYFNDSVPALLNAAYPNHVWHVWKFSLVPKGWWNDITNRRNFFDWLKSQLHYQTFDDFYNLTSDMIAEHGGIYVLKFYKRSVALALQNVYPEHKWHMWKFKTLPRIIPNTIMEEALAVVQSLAKDLGFTSPSTSEAAEQALALERWYRVPHSKIPARILAVPGGLSGLLRQAYPFHPWEDERFVWSSKKLSSQYTLMNMIETYLPSQWKEHVQLPTTRPNAESSDFIRHQRTLLDLYDEQLRLAVEYQGVQHYFDQFVYGQHFWTSEVDEMKAIECALQQITLIEVPFWWDNTFDSIAATLTAIRPNDVQFFGFSTAK